MSFEVMIEQSNREDFFLNVAIDDADTGEPVDITGAEIAFTIRDACHCEITHSLTDGYVTVVAPNELSIHFAAAEIKRLRVGTAKLGVVYRKNDEVTQLLIGDISIYDGVARL